MNESFVLGKGRLNAVWYCDREERCDFCAAGWNPVRRLAIAARAGCQPARSLPSCPTKELFFAVKASERDLEADGVVARLLRRERHAQGLFVLRELEFAAVAQQFQAADLCHRKFAAEGQRR